MAWPTQQNCALDNDTEQLYSHSKHAVHIGAWPRGQPIRNTVVEIKPDRQSSVDYYLKYTPRLTYISYQQKSVVSNTRPIKMSSSELRKKELGYKRDR